MSNTVQRTPKSGRQSLFFRDLASPVSTCRGGGGKFATPGQAAAVSAAWRENFAASNLSPPPVFTLEDRSDFSSESGIPDYPGSPEINSDPRTPVRVRSLGRGFSIPKSKSEASTSSQQSSVASLSWWSSGKSGGGGGGEQDDKGKGSPVEGVVQPGALVTVPPPREVARPGMERSLLLVGDPDEEEWITVYGFSPGDTNIVLREFEKCGVILKHVPGPRNANWIHILYRYRSDAQRALSKDGMQINGVLIVGVKPVDPAQRQVLNERMKNPGFMTLPPAPLSKSSEPTPLRASPCLQNGHNSVRQSPGTIASPSRSVVSKIVDLIFGV